MATPDKLADFAIQQFNNLSTAVNHVLPTATKYILQVTSLSCFINLLAAWTFLGLVLFLWGFWVFCYNRMGPGSQNYRGDGFAYILTGVLLSILTLICFVVQVCSFWWYVGWFHPELYLVHEAASKFVSL